MDNCPACGEPYRNSNSNFCQKCGAPRPNAKPNTCTNLSCENHHVDLGPDAQFCDICGYPTDIGKQIEDLT